MLVNKVFGCKILTASLRLQILKKQKKMTKSQKRVRFIYYVIKNEIIKLIFFVQIKSSCSTSNSNSNSTSNNNSTSNSSSMSNSNNNSTSNSSKSSGSKSCDI